MLVRLSAMKIALWEEDYDSLAELYAGDIVIMNRKRQAVSSEEVVKQLDHFNLTQILSPNISWIDPSLLSCTMTHRLFCMYCIPQRY